MPRLICAWCKADMGESPATAKDSHGICPACEQKYFPKEAK